MLPYSALSVSAKALRPESNIGHPFRHMNYKSRSHNFAWFNPCMALLHRISLHVHIILILITIIVIVIVTIVIIIVLIVIIIVVIIIGIIVVIVIIIVVIVIIIISSLRIWDDTRKRGSELHWMHGLFTVLA